MNTKELGKITHVAFGYGGYQDAQFGISLVFLGKGWGTREFIGTWADWSKGCQWTKESQNKIFGDTVVRLRDLLKDAGKQELTELKGVPVEVTFKNGVLASWRILKEVI